MFISVKFDDGTLMRVVRFKTREELEAYKKELESEYRLKLVGTKKESEGFIFVAYKRRTPIWKSRGLHSTSENSREPSKIGFGEIKIDLSGLTKVNYDGKVKISDDGDKKFIWE